jgi:parallel beta-helix repeat protein
MFHLLRRLRAPAVGAAMLCVVAADCDSRSSRGTRGAALTTGQTTRICPGPDAQKQALIAFFDAREGDTIEFCEGQFDFDTGLVMTGKRGITIKGAGLDKTILSFKQSPAQDGLSINRVDGITIEGLTIYDAPGNGLRIFRSQFVTIRGVKVGWSNADPASPNYDPSMKSWTQNGSYAFYPVICRHILIEDCVSVGSSDAGVYVGQSSDILVRRTEAFNNVAGFEFENTYRAEFVDNVAHDNVGGFLVFDLPGRVQYGEKNLVHHNRSFNNNTPSFAPRGAIVGDVPSGTGMLVLASDQLELYENDIYEQPHGRLRDRQLWSRRSERALDALRFLSRRHPRLRQSLPRQRLQPSAPRLEPRSVQGRAGVSPWFSRPR